MPEMTAVEIGEYIHKKIQKDLDRAANKIDERGVLMQSFDPLNGMIRVDHAYIDMWKRALRTQRDFINTIWSRRCIRTRQRLRGAKWL